MTTAYPQTFRRFSELFGMTRETTSISNTARAACENGFAVIAVRPETKIPMCTLTAAETKKADQAARDEMAALGKTRWESATHACGRAHAITDPKAAKRVFERLERQGPVNIGVDPGRSRWLCVDVDQRADVNAWMSYWAERSGDPTYIGSEPSVSSPGVLTGDGTWKHKDGGHVWYWLPEGMSFEASDVHHPMPMLGGRAQVYINDALVLVPPSVRPEGPYTMRSDVCQAPDWLIAEVIEFIEQQTIIKERVNGSADMGDSAIDRWSLTVSWDALLSEDGWTFTHKTDRCSCPIWSRPGSDRGSDKSATAHEAGCLRYDVDPSESPGFLHLWTDNPPSDLQAYVNSTGKKSITKFSYISWTQFDGDNGATMRALGIGGKPELTPLTNASLAGIESSPGIPAAPVTAPLVAAPPPVTASLTPFTVYTPPPDDESGDRPGDGDGDEPDPAAPQIDPAVSAAPPADYFTADEIDDVEPPEQLVEGLLIRGGYSRVIGQSNHGKTFFVIDLVAHIACGMPWRGRAVTQGRVCFVAAEDFSGVALRTRAWKKHHGVSPGNQLLFKASAVQVIDEIAWRLFVVDMQRYRPELIVIDTQAASTYGLEENSNDDGGRLNRRMIELKTLVGCGVLLVHHKGHQAKNGRGASSVHGALDTEISVDKSSDSSAGKTLVTISCTKQKNMTEFEDFMASIVTVAGTESAVLIGDDTRPEKATTLTPLDKQPAVASGGGGGGTDSPLRRLARYVWAERLTGVTKTEIARNLGHTRSDTAHPRMHRETLGRALQQAVANNWFADVATGLPVVAAGEDSPGFIVYRPTLRVMLTASAIHELGLESEN